MNQKKEKVTVVKVGGKIVETPSALQALITAFSQMEGRKVLVHGGGRTATDMAARLGIETQMVGGRRITDADMLAVVTMVYGGLVNKQVVAQLQAAGVNALGLTGADMDVLRSHRRPAGEVDYGFVGDVERADGARLQMLIEGGVVPVMAPLTHDGRGQLLNTNADTIAAETAKALAREGASTTLVYCFEKAGVLADPDDEGSVISTINHDEFVRLVANGTISGGMIPKITNALAAVDAGVERVIITKAENIGTSTGTVITR